MQLLSVFYNVIMNLFLAVFCAVCFAAALVCCSCSRK